MWQINNDKIITNRLKYLNFTIIYFKDVFSLKNERNLCKQDPKPVVNTTNCVELLMCVVACV